MDLVRVPEEEVWFDCLCMIRHCFHLILGGGGDLTKQKWESDTFSFVLLQHDDAKQDETRSLDVVNSSKFAQWFLEDGMHAFI